MANALYEAGRNAFLSGSIAWVADNIKLHLVNIVGVASPYVFDAAHLMFASVPTSARIATSASLSAKAAASGIADADDTICSAVSGPTAGAIIIFKEGASHAASLLIAYIDTATGLPVQPNGGDITTQWDSGANKIFKL